MCSLFDKVFQNGGFPCKRSLSELQRLGSPTPSLCGGEETHVRSLGWNGAKIGQKLELQIDGRPVCEQPSCVPVCVCVCPGLSAP